MEVEYKKSVLTGSAFNIWNRKYQWRKYGRRQVSAACKTLHRVLGRLLYSTALTVVPYSIFMMLCTGKKFCSRRGVTGEGSDYFFHEGGRHFLSPLQAVPGEEPFVFVKKAAECLENHTVKRKEVLDQILAERVGEQLPQEKKKLWNGLSMYGNPDRQTVGAAVVSFLLHLCSFSSLVVFGQSHGTSPSFTSMKNWLSRDVPKIHDGGHKLVRKFRYGYGSSTEKHFMNWLGCSQKQEERLWSGILGEVEPVSVEGKTCFILQEDREALTSREQNKLKRLGETLCGFPYAEPDGFQNG